MALWNNDPNVMLVAGHRGACRIRPENTMTAFQYAIDAGVDMIETDIRQTKDNQPGLVHERRGDARPSAVPRADPAQQRGAVCFSSRMGQTRSLLRKTMKEEDTVHWKEYVIVLIRNGAL